MSGNSHLTLNLVKEAIFQVLEGRLGPELENYAFFDLCAGSGQMAFEAFSRGFAAVHLAEVDGGRLAHLISEAKRGEFDVRIHRRDFRRMAPLIFRHPRSVVFLDPPYSFWKGNGGESDAVDRLVHNLANPSEESRALLDEYRARVKASISGSSYTVPANTIRLRARRPHPANLRCTSPSTNAATTASSVSAYCILH